MVVYWWWYLKYIESYHEMYKALFLSTLHVSSYINIRTTLQIVILSVDILQRGTEDLSDLLSGHTSYKWRSCDKLNPDCLPADPAARILHCPSLRIMHPSHWVPAVCHVLNFYIHIHRVLTTKLADRNWLPILQVKKNDTHIGKVHVQGHKARSGVGTWIQIFISPVPTKLEWPWNASCLIIGWQDSDSADAIGSAIRQFGSYVNLHRSLIFPGPAFSPSTTWR